MYRPSKVELTRFHPLFRPNTHQKLDRKSFNTCIGLTSETQHITEVFHVTEQHIISSSLPSFYSIEWTKNGEHCDGVTYAELYLCFQHCFGCKVGLKTHPKYPEFKSCSIFCELEDNRNLGEETRTFSGSIATLETLLGIRLVPGHHDLQINRRYPKTLQLTGFQVDFNFPFAHEAKKTISDLCGECTNRTRRCAAVLALKQASLKKFPKHSQSYLCAEDLLSTNSAQTMKWMQHRSEHVKYQKTTTTNIFAHDDHVSRIQSHLENQFPGIATVN